MKKVLFFLTIFLLLLPVISLAQQEEGPRIKSAELSFGDSAFTSGLNMSLVFSLSPNKDFELVGNSERFYTTMNFKVGKKISLDATGGVFKKLPWAGPRIVYYPVKPLMLLYWGGWSSGRIGELGPRAKSFCQQLSAYYSPRAIKNLSVGYNIVKLDVYKTTQLPEIAYGYNLTEDIKIGASATYDTVARKPLFCMSMRYTFTKK